MKKKILLGIVIGLAILCISMFLTDKYMVEHGKEPVFVFKSKIANDGGTYTAKGLFYTINVQKNIYSDIEKIEMYVFDKCIAGSIANINYLPNEQNDLTSVTIKNNKIQNEDLIDEFIQNATNEKGDTLEINIDGKICKVEFIEAQENTKQYNENGSVTVTVPQYDGEMSRDFDVEYAKKYYGYYKVTYNDGIVEEYSPLSRGIKRRIRENNVIVYFDIIAPGVDVASIEDLKTICEYSLESSNYKKIVDISYNQRKDMGIYEIYDNKEYKLKTFGGNVSITVEGDMVYELKDALEQKIITCEDILNQVKVDEKYGICEKHFFSDGGSTEYLYSGYTILKLNTLSGDQDLIIGMQGSIINSYNKNK